jgi:hypothetical protein
MLKARVERPTDAPEESYIKSVSTESNLMLAYEAKTVPRRGHTSTQWDRARLAVDAR